MSSYLSALMLKIIVIQLIVALASKVTVGGYTSLFIFGDSVVDTGNLIQLFPPDHLPNSAFYPFGTTYFHHPTGRFSDGRVVVDFLAEYLGLPFPPPYFGKTMPNFKQGANFAVGGASALDFSFHEQRHIHLPTNVSLEVQLDLFKKLLPTLCSKASAYKKLLGNSFIHMGDIGGNDYGISVVKGKSMEYIRSLVPLVIKATSMAIKEVIKLGAVTVMVPGLLPLGCSPAMLTHFVNKSVPEDFEPSTGCLSRFNKFTEFHNEQLQIELRQIQELYPHAKIIYADRYNVVKRLYSSPDEFGFTSDHKACCGVGEPYNFSFEKLCGENKEATLCDDPSKHISWDGAHYTEAALRLISKAAFEGPHFTAHCTSSWPRVDKCSIYTNSSLWLN